MPKAGYLTVLGMLLLAAVLAIFNLFYQRQRTVHTLTYWGPDHRLIVAADHVDIVLLEPVTAASQGTANPEREAQTNNPAEQKSSASPAGPVKFITVDQVRYREVETKPGADARGLLHIRRALVDDGAYLWDKTPPADQRIEFRYALEFSDGDESAATVLFSDDGNWVRSANSDRSLAVKPNDKSVSPFLSFLQEQFDQPAPPSEPTEPGEDASPALKPDIPATETTAS